MIAIGCGILGAADSDRIKDEKKGARHTPELRQVRGF
jgi:hypothetical protein